MSTATVLLSILAATVAISAGYWWGALGGRRYRALAESLLDPLMQQSQQQQAMLAPLVARANLGARLLEIGEGRTRRGELPELLGEIAKQGSFDAVVLADQTGLPVAASANTARAEALAACSSLVLTLKDRLQSTELAAARTVTVLDEAHRTTIYRCFVSEGEPFLLIAVTADASVPAEILDPAVARVEGLLGRVE